MIPNLVKLLINLLLAACLALNSTTVIMLPCTLHRADYLPNSALVVLTLLTVASSRNSCRLTQRQNLFSSSPSDTGIAADVSQDVNIVDVGGHMRSPFDTAVSRKLVGGSPNDASILASK